MNSNPTTEPARFTVGASATTGPGDYRWDFTVTKRTACFVTLVDQFGDERRTKIETRDWDGSGDEFTLPFGRFSQAPVASPVAS